MAVIVDNVYQKVLALANKEQRGYITPQEFNLLADRAQNEIYNNYFYNIKTAEQKPKNQMGHSDEVELTQEKLAPFIDTSTATTTSANVAFTNVYKLISVTRGGNICAELDNREVHYIENNPLTSATVARSTYTRASPTAITVFPAPTTSTSFVITYYKYPELPNWGYVVVSEKALYNEDTSTNFELHASEEEELVNKILILAGITIQKPDLQQAGADQMKITQQEQNS